MARIVQASNFDKDWFNEEFILWPMPEESCKQIARVINEACCPNSEYYYKVVDNDYKLYIGMVP